MQYFVLNPIADAGAGDFCFSNCTPDGIATRWYRLAIGKAFGDDYPSGDGEVTLRLGDDYPGLRLPSFIGNTTGMVVVDGKTADVMASHRLGRVERLPFTLLDHKRRVYSKDYVFINPLECREVMNADLSEVRRSYKGEIKAVKRLVLDPEKLHDAPDLFRLGEYPGIYLFSEALVHALARAQCTNFHFTEAAQA